MIILNDFTPTQGILSDGNHVELINWFLGIVIILLLTLIGALLRRSWSTNKERKDVLQRQDEKDRGILTKLDDVLEKMSKHITEQDNCNKITFQAQWAYLRIIEIHLKSLEKWMKDKHDYDPPVWIPERESASV